MALKSGEKYLALFVGHIWSKPKSTRWTLIGLRLLAFLAAAAATLVMALNKQNKTFVVATIGTTPVNLTLTAKFQHTPAFVVEAPRSGGIRSCPTVHFRSVNSLRLSTESEDKTWIGANIGVNVPTMNIAGDIKSIIFMTTVPYFSWLDYMHRFFVIANGLVSIHNLVVIMVDLFGSKFDYKGFRFPTIAILDMLNVALVSGGANAAAFMAELGKNGNSHARWDKICDKFGAYCDRGAGALVASFIALALMLLISFLSILKLTLLNSSSPN